MILTVPFHYDVIGYMPRKRLPTSAKIKGEVSLEVQEPSDFDIVARIPLPYDNQGPRYDLVFWDDRFWRPLVDEDDNTDHDARFLSAEAFAERIVTEGGVRGFWADSASGFHGQKVHESVADTGFRQVETSQFEDKAKQVLEVFRNVAIFQGKAYIPTSEPVYCVTSDRYGRSVDVRPRSETTMAARDLVRLDEFDAMLEDLKNGRWGLSEDEIKEFETCRVEVLRPDLLRWNPRTEWLVKQFGFYLKSFGSKDDRRTGSVLHEASVDLFTKFAAFRDASQNLADDMPIGELEHLCEIAESLLDQCRHEDVNAHSGGELHKAISKWRQHTLLSEDENYINSLAL